MSRSINMAAPGIRLTRFGQIDHFDTQDGVMLCHGIARHPGVLVYYHRDGTITRELVSTDLLRGFQDGEPIAATLGGIPVCTNHPPIMLKGIQSRIDKYGVGETKKKIFVSKDGTTEVVFEITDSAGQEEVRSGRHPGLSLGYFAATKKKDGVFLGARHDSEQIPPFESDHLATCPVPRARDALITHFDGLISHFDGEELSTDIAYASVDLDRPLTFTKKDARMLVQLGNTSVELDGPAAQIVSSYVDSTDQKMVKLNEEKEEMKEERDEYKKKADQLDEVQAELDYANTMIDGYKADAENNDGGKSGKMDADKIAAEAQARIDCWATVAKCVAPGQNLRLDSSVEAFTVKDGALGVDFKLDTADVNKALVKVIHKDGDFSEKSNDYIQAYIDSHMRAVANVKSATPDPKTDSSDVLRSIINKSRPVGKQDGTTSKSLRQQRMDAQQKLSRMPVKQALAVKNGG